MNLIEELYRIDIENKAFKESLSIDNILSNVLECPDDNEVIII